MGKISITRKFLIALSAIFIIFCAAAVISACSAEILPPPDSPENLQWNMEEWTISWNEVDGAVSYKIMTDETDEIYQTTETEFDLEFILTTESTNTVSVCSVGEKGAVSDWSELLVQTEIPTEALTYTLMEDGQSYEVSRKYTNPNTQLKGRVVIADYYNGLPVTSIAESAFYKSWSGSSSSSTTDNSVTTSVHLPKYLKTIGKYAFSQCVSLQKIKMPDTVTELGYGAFYHCEYLGEVKLSANLTSISVSAFEGTALSQITIPYGITSIGASAFAYCDFAYVSLPESIVRIGSGAFSVCRYLTAIELPESITEIKSETFYQCERLLNIKIPEGVTLIGSSAFRGCSRLTSVELPESLAEIGSFAFQDCECLKNINLPESLTEMSSYAFKNCISLKEIDLPEGVTSIGEYAFSGCESLSTFTVKQNITEIGDSAFLGCYKLIEICNLSNLDITAGSEENGYIACYAKNVYTQSGGASAVIQQGDFQFIRDGGNYYLFNYTGGGGDITLPELSVNGEQKYYAVYDYAFCYNREITSVIMGSSVTGIGESAFCGCYSLYSVVIGENVSCIDSRAFSACSKLVEVYNLSSLELAMGESTFGYAAYYAKVIHTTAETASVVFEQDGYKFCNLSGTNYLLGYTGSDTSLTLPSLYVNGEIVNYEIYHRAFYENVYITEVVVPDGVTGIGEYAFSYCVSLKTVYISKSVIFIGERAFLSCRQLESVVFENVKGWHVYNETYGEIEISQAGMGNASLIAEYFIEKFLNWDWYCSKE